MKYVVSILFSVSLLVILMGCSADDTVKKVIAPETTTLKYLALGDSYTIGQSVCETCRFPEQLKDSIADELNRDVTVKVIARTGWTTSNLLSAIDTEAPSNDYDLVTLLIGVNNQYQNIPFQTYEVEFPQLVDKAIRFAKGDLTKVIVVSIPDYAYTPFGQASSNPQNISDAIDSYNNFAKNYCLSRNIKFVDITPITRRGLAESSLVASDGLHPSELSYTQFVGLLLPIAIPILQ